MLCFKIWIFLFVLKLFNILHSFLVTLVYWLQDKGKPLGLCSAQAIEVFTSTGVSGLRNLLKKKRLGLQRILFSTTTLRQLWDNFDTTWRKLGDNLETTLKQFWDNFETTLIQLWNNLETTWRQLGDNLETTWIQLKYNFVTTWTQRRHNFGKTMTQLWQNSENFGLD